MPRVSGPRIVERREGKRGPRQHRRELRHLDQCTWARAARDGGKNSARPRRARSSASSRSRDAGTRALSIDRRSRKGRVGSLIMNTVPYRLQRSVRCYSHPFAVFRLSLLCPSVQNDVGSDWSEDSRESRRSPSRHEREDDEPFSPQVREDDEPFERSVKDRSGGGATKPPGDKGTEGCSSWLAPVGRGGAVVSTCMQSHPGTTALRVAPYGSHFGRTLALPSPALGSRTQPPSRAVPGARDNEESRYASHQSVAIMRRVNLGVNLGVASWCLKGNSSDP
jgi:hypothetical protein